MKSRTHRRFGQRQRGLAVTQNLVLILFIGICALPALSALGETTALNIAGAAGAGTARQPTFSIPDISLESSPVSNPRQQQRMPTVGFAQHAGLAKLATVVDELAQIDRVNWLVRGADAFNELPQQTRKAALTDWQGAVAYGALHPELKLGAADLTVGVARDSGEWKRALNARGVVREQVNSLKPGIASLRELLEHLASREDELHDASSLQRKTLRLHGLARAQDVPYRDRFVSRTSLEKYFPEESAAFDGRLLLSELDKEAATDVAKQLAVFGTAPKWVENHVDLLWQQARFQHDLQTRFKLKSSRYTLHGLGDWMPDPNQSANHLGDWPWSDTLLTTSLNEGLDFHPAYSLDELPAILDRWRAIPEDDAARPELAELVEPALHMLVDNAQLQLDELRRLKDKWGDAPLLHPADLDARIRLLEMTVEDAKEMSNKPALSKRSYLRFVESFSNSVDEATIVTDGGNSVPTALFSPGGTLAGTGAMPLPTQGYGTWTLDDDFSWLAKAVDRERGIVHPRPTLPVEFPLGGKPHGDTFAGTTGIANHMGMQIKSIHQALLHSEERLLQVVSAVEEAESRLTGLAAGSAPYQSLKDWIRHTRTATVEAFWESSGRGLPDPSSAPR